MKITKLTVCLLFLTVLFFTPSCKDGYDDSELVGRVENLENRVQKLEEQMNSNISSLQAILEALDNNDYITKVVPITNGEKEIGYTMHFSKGNSINIYHGQDGQNGYTPQIGVRQDTDGIYYWTLDGEWMTDESGNKIKAQATDGQNGRVPQLKVEDGYWFVSYNEGLSWEKLGQATGDKGDSMFEDIIIEEDNVQFILTNGTNISIPNNKRIDINFELTNNIVVVPNIPTYIKYTLTGVSDNVTVDAIGTNNIKVRVIPEGKNGGTIKILLTESLDEYSKVIVFVSDGVHKEFKTLTFEEGTINIIQETYHIEYMGGNINIPINTNIDYVFEIEENAKTWIKSVDSRSLNTYNHSFIISENTGVSRSAFITFKDKEGVLEKKVSIIQDASILSINGTECEIRLDMSNSVSEIEKAIVKAEEAGVVKYTLKGDFGKLGILDGKVESNPFKYAPNAKVIDFSYVVNWPDVDIDNDDSVEGKGMPNCAFFGFENIKEIILPAEVEYMGNSAFYRCFSLERIEMSSVKRIGGNCFWNCKLLKEINLPVVERLDDFAFFSCNSLVNLEIPNVKYLGSSSLSGLLTSSMRHPN